MTPGVAARLQRLQFHDDTDRHLEAPMGYDEAHFRANDLPKEAYDGSCAPQ